MDFLKELFKDGALDWDAFTKAINDKGYKIADLSKGEYVSKGKFDDEIKNKDAQIKGLNDQLSTRDTDLKNLQKQLKDVSDNGAELKTVTDQLKKLQIDYGESEKKYKEQLAQQAYEFAVKEFANEQKFTSSAAKRDFVRSLIGEKLKMEDGKILGANDYLDKYKTDNADAITEPKKEEPAGKEPPQFVQATGKQSKPDTPNPFVEAFHFTGVRPEKTN